MKFLATLLLLTLTCFGQVVTEKSKDTRMSDIQWRAFVASNQTEQSALRSNLSEPDDIHCTAEFIGPQALMTATHCELPVDDIHIVGVGNARILRRERDSLDHTIYFIDTDFHTLWVPVNQNHIQITEHIFTWQNPGEFNSIYSEGYFAGVKVNTVDSPFGPIPDPNNVTTMYILPMYYGTSGSGIFRVDTGELVGILSATYDLQDISKDGKVTLMQFAGANPLRFDQKVLDEAAKFTTPQPKKEEKKDGNTDSSSTKPISQSNTSK